MNQYANPHSAYKSGAATLSKTRQVVMLYDGIVKFVKQAAEAQKIEDYAERFNLLQKACTVVLGLQSSLDFEKGGKISEILNRYYSSLDLRISMLNQTESMEDFEKVIKDIKKMRDSWEEVDKKSSEENRDSALASQVLPNELPRELALAVSI